MSFSYLRNHCYVFKSSVLSDKYKSKLPQCSVKPLLIMIVYLAVC